MHYVTSGTLLESHGLYPLFRTHKKTTNTREINTRRKSGRPDTQMKTTETMGEKCGGLDGASGLCLDSAMNGRRW